MSNAQTKQVPTRPQQDVHDVAIVKRSIHQGGGVVDVGAGYCGCKLFAVVSVRFDKNEREVDKDDHNDKAAHPRIVVGTVEGSGQGCW